MFKNIELSEINKKAVSGSVWVPVVVVFIALLITFFISDAISMGSRSAPFLNIFLGTAIFILVGTIIWLPCLLFSLLLEKLFIRSRTTVNGVFLILIVELIITLGVFNFFMESFYNHYFYLSITIGLIAQASRWIYLKSKNRMYKGISESKINYYGKFSKATH